MSKKFKGTANWLNNTNNPNEGFGSMVFHINWQEKDGTYKVYWDGDKTGVRYSRKDLREHYDNGWIKIISNETV